MAIAAIKAFACAPYEDSSQGNQFVARTGKVSDPRIGQFPNYYKNSESLRKTIPAY